MPFTSMNIFHRSSKISCHGLLIFVKAFMKYSRNYLVIHPPELSYIVHFVEMGIDGKYLPFLHRINHRIFWIFFKYCHLMFKILTHFGKYLLSSINDIFWYFNTGSRASFTVFLFIFLFSLKFWQNSRSEWRQPEWVSRYQVKAFFMFTTRSQIILCKIYFRYKAHICSLHKITYINTKV